MSKTNIKSKGLRLWRRDAFREMLKVMPKQDYLPWYQEQGIRLKNYVEPYFDALSGKCWADVTAEELQEVYDFFKEHGETLDVPFLLYVGELLLSAKGKGSPRLFEGFELKCCCGGTWVLNRNSVLVKDWKYNCNSCDARSNADISGFPISLPAPRSVQEGRIHLHNKMKAICHSYSQISVDDIYSMISYFTSTPVGYVHFGYLQSDDGVDCFANALSKIERSLGMLKEGSTVSDVLMAS
ncbi:hypothetical protein [Vibrio owensii]|uniref:hypothetical protein n=1 Tax=Vibrio owensii TaxID=696485 RepID=UPI0018F1FB74|nr:hypothetical protein [Vibrio owensii]